MCYRNRLYDGFPSSALSNRYFPKITFQSMYTFSVYSWSLMLISQAETSKPLEFDISERHSLCKLCVLHWRKRSWDQLMIAVIHHPSSSSIIINHWYCTFFFVHCHTGLDLFLQWVSKNKKTTTSLVPLKRLLLETNPAFWECGALVG